MDMPESLIKSHCFKAPQIAGVWVPLWGAMPPKVPPSRGQNGPFLHTIAKPMEIKIIFPNNIRTMKVCSMKQNWVWGRLEVREDHPHPFLRELLPFLTAMFFLEIKMVKILTNFLTAMLGYIPGQRKSKVGNWIFEKFLYFLYCPILRIKNFRSIFFWKLKWWQF